MGEAPSKRPGISADELRPLIEQLANRESTLLPAGVGLPYVALYEGVSIRKGYAEKPVVIELHNRGGQRSQFLTAEQARHIAALLIAAADAGS